MLDKIIAYFGADDSDFQRKIKSMTASAKGMSENISRGVKLLEFGAVLGGVSKVIQGMKAASDYAKSLGDNATDAQKSAALWGEEFESFTNIVKDKGASLLGTLAGWGRSFGNLFRSEAEIAADALVEAGDTGSYFDLEDALVIQDSRLSQWMGNIYRRETTMVTAI